MTQPYHAWVYSQRTPYPAPEILAYPRPCHSIHEKQELEPSWMSIRRIMDNENVAHVHNGLLCSCMKKWNYKFIDKWIELEIIILGDVTKTQKDKFCMFSLICEYYLWVFRSVCLTLDSHGRQEETERPCEGGTSTDRDWNTGCHFFSKND